MNFKKIYDDVKDLNCTKKHVNCTKLTYNCTKNSIIAPNQVRIAPKSIRIAHPSVKWKRTANDGQSSLIEKPLAKEYANGSFETLPWKNESSFC